MCKMQFELHDKYLWCVYSFQRRRAVCLNQSWAKVILHALILFNIYGWTGLYQHNILYQKEFLKNTNWLQPLCYLSVLCYLLSGMGRRWGAQSFHPSNSKTCWQWHSVRVLKFRHIPRIGHQIGLQNQYFYTVQNKVKISLTDTVMIWCFFLNPC